MPIQIPYLGYAMTTSAIGLPGTLEAQRRNEVTMGLGLQPKGLTAGVADH